MMPGISIKMFLLLILWYVEGYGLHPVAGDLQIAIPQRIVLKINPAVAVSRRGNLSTDQVETLASSVHPARPTRP